VNRTLPVDSRKIQGITENNTIRYAMRGTFDALTQKRGHRYRSRTLFPRRSKGEPLDRISGGVCPVVLATQIETGSANLTPSKSHHLVFIKPFICCHHNSLNLFRVNQSEMLFGKQVFYEQELSSAYESTRPSPIPEPDLQLL